MRRQIFGCYLIAFDEMEPGRRKRGARQQALRDRVGRGDDDRVGTLEEVEERRQPVGDHRRRGRHRLERRDVPGRKQMHASFEPRRRLALTEEKREVAGQRLRLGEARGEHETRRRPCAVRFGDEERATAAAQSLDAKRPAALDSERAAHDVVEGRTLGFGKTLHTPTPAKVRDPASDAKLATPARARNAVAPTGPRVAHAWRAGARARVSTRSAGTS